MSFTRRDFVKFMGGALAAPAFLNLTSCQSGEDALMSAMEIAPSDLDELVTIKGLHWKKLVSWNDKISTKDTFGFNNDYTAFFPLSKNRAILWVNHEYPHPLFLHGHFNASKTKEEVDRERYNLGGSLIEIENKNGEWKLVENSQYNRRVSGLTPIPFVAPRKIQGSSQAIGTFSNCAGGTTPWGTVLTCEENYQDMFGEVFHDGKTTEGAFGWAKYYDHHPHHYGWVVEVNPKTGEAKKLTALGRFSHEGCTTARTKDGRVVAYSGDDKANQFIYKFISKEKDSLDEGELFVADLVNGKWLSLDIEKSEVLKKTFKDQLEVLTHCRKAGKLLGATPCDRPEDIEIHPTTGDIYVALTNNYSKKDMKNPKNNFYGKILKISHKGGDHLSENLASSDFVLGGENSKMACPDNLVFDKLGNLWVTTDMSGSMMNKFPYEKFKNNGLFYIPLSGEHAGRPFQVASAPKDAELTGVTFSDDFKTLFMAVQHPGERSKSLDKLTSHWPDGGDSMPKPAVVQLSGEFLDRLMS